MFQCRKSAGKDFKIPAQLFLFSKGWKMDVLAEAGAGVLHIRRYYKTPFLSQDSCDLKNQNNCIV